MKGAAVCGGAYARGTPGSRSGVERVNIDPPPHYTVFLGPPTITWVEETVAVLWCSRLCTQCSSRGAVPKAGGPRPACPSCRSACSIPSHELKRQTIVASTGCADHRAGKKVQCNGVSRGRRVDRGLRAVNPCSGNAELLPHGPGALAPRWSVTCPCDAMAPMWNSVAATRSPSTHTDGHGDPVETLTHA